MEISEVLDGRTITLDQQGVLRIEHEGQVITIEPHTAAMLKLFVNRPDVDSRLEVWLIQHEKGNV